MGWDPIVRRFYIAGCLLAIPFAIALFFVDGGPERWVTLAFCLPFLGLAVGFLVSRQRRRGRAHR